MKYLVRQCPECKSVIKIQVDIAGRIVNVEGGRQPRLYNRDQSPAYATRSNKMVLCSGTLKLPTFGAMPCGAYLQIRCFKEIKC